MQIPPPFHHGDQSGKNLGKAFPLCTDSTLSQAKPDPRRGTATVSQSLMFDCKRDNSTSSPDSPRSSEISFDISGLVAIVTWQGVRWNKLVCCVVSWADKGDQCEDSEQSKGLIRVSGLYMVTKSSPSLRCRHCVDEKSFAHSIIMLVILQGPFVISASSPTVIYLSIMGSNTASVGSSYISSFLCRR